MSPSLSAAEYADIASSALITRASSPAVSAAHSQAQRTLRRPRLVLALGLESLRARTATQTRALQPLDWAQRQRSGHRRPRSRRLLVAAPRQIDLVTHSWLSSGLASAAGIVGAGTAARADRDRTLRRRWRARAPAALRRRRRARIHRCSPHTSRETPTADSTIRCAAVEATRLLSLSWAVPNVQIRPAQAARAANAMSSCNQGVSQADHHWEERDRCGRGCSTRCRACGRRRKRPEACRVLSVASGGDPGPPGGPPVHRERTTSGQNGSDSAPRHTLRLWEPLARI